MHSTSPHPSVSSHDTSEVVSATHGLLDIFFQEYIFPYMIQHTDDILAFSLLEDIIQTKKISEEEQASLRKELYLGLIKHLLYACEHCIIDIFSPLDTQPLPDLILTILQHDPTFKTSFHSAYEEIRTYTNNDATDTERYLWAYCIAQGIVEGVNIYNHLDNPYHITQHILQKIAPNQKDDIILENNAALLRDILKNILPNFHTESWTDSRIFPMLHALKNYIDNKHTIHKKLLNQHAHDHPLYDDLLQWVNNYAHHNPDNIPSLKPYVLPHDLVKIIDNFGNIYHIWRITDNYIPHIFNRYTLIVCATLFKERHHTSLPALLHTLHKTHPNIAEVTHTYHYALLTHYYAYYLAITTITYITTLSIITPIFLKICYSHITFSLCASMIIQGWCAAIATLMLSYILLKITAYLAPIIYNTTSIILSYIFKQTAAFLAIMQHNIDALYNPVRSDDLRTEGPQHQNDLQQLSSDILTSSAQNDLSRQHP